MIRTFKYKLKPTKVQTQTFFCYLDSLKELHNNAREMRIKSWKWYKTPISYYDQIRWLGKQRRKHKEIAVIPQDLQNHTLIRVNKAFQNFFRRQKQGLKKGFPRYRERYRSFEWTLRPRPDTKARSDPITKTDYRHDLLFVPKVGKVKIYLHRPIEGTPKTISIVKKASGWYAQITCKLPDTEKVEPETVTAVDMGLTHYLTTAQGQKVENPRYYRKAENGLAKKQRKLSKTEKGSKRNWKARFQVALYHERTTNKRTDFLGKLCYKLFHRDNYDLVVAENLQIANMVKNSKLSKSIHDASWYQFFDWCRNIAERDGFYFKQVDPKNSSQTCSKCQTKVEKKLDLSVRTFKCSECGFTLDRDQNAAINLLIRAASVLRGASLIEALNRETGKLLAFGS